MKTIETTVVIGPDRTITVPAPPGIAPGEHRVVVVIEEERAAPTGDRPPLDFPVIDVGPWPEGLSLRREDMYGDDGR